MDAVDGDGVTGGPLSSLSDPSSALGGWSPDLTCLNFSTVSVSTPVVFLAVRINGCFNKSLASGLFLGFLVTH